MTRQRDGKSKLDHVREMLANAVSKKQLSFRTVLMDSWYAERKLMRLVEDAGQDLLLSAQKQSTHRRKRRSTPVSAHG